MGLKNWLESKREAKKQDLLQHARKIGANFVVMEFDALSKKTYPAFDKVSRTWREAYMRYGKDLNFIVDILEVEDEKVKV